MIETQSTETITIPLTELKERVALKFTGKARLVQIGCTRTGEGQFEVNYSFDENLSFSNFRVVVNSAVDQLPSISGIYWNAFLYENEIHDLFGITVDGMVIDYKGRFYRMAVKQPFATTSAKEKKP